MHIKDVPALAEPLTVLRVDHVRNRVTVIVVSVPESSNATQVTYDNYRTAMSVNNLSTLSTVG